MDLRLAALAVLVFVLVLQFSSRKEQLRIQPDTRRLHREASAVFKKKPTYKKYRREVTGTDSDPVAYDAIQCLVRDGNFDLYHLQKFRDSR
jgi:hypothetical protein